VYVYTISVELDHLHRAVSLTQTFYGASSLQSFNASQYTHKTPFKSTLSYLFGGQAVQHVAAMLFPVFRSRFISETAWSRDIGAHETVLQGAEDSSTEPYVRMAGCAPTAAVRGMSNLLQLCHGQDWCSLACLPLK
jgi:hypothetical protein